MRTLILCDSNTLYAPAGEECWVILAKEIMTSYAIKYKCQIPTTAMTQEEYNKLDKKTFLPIRRSILRNIQNGPLRNIANMDAIYRALEYQRIKYKQSLGIIWEDAVYDDITKF